MFDQEIDTTHPNPARSTTAAGQKAGGEEKSQSAPPWSNAWANQIPPALAGELGIQARLEVSRPGEPLEEEADRLAGQVGQEPGAGAISLPAGSPLSGPAAASEAGLADLPPVVQEALHTSGRPLDPASKTELEGYFGAELGSVRVHDNPDAARSAAAMNAQAYTVGDHIVFGEGQYDQAAGAGKQLLAHEVVHTLQQREGGAALRPKLLREPRAGAHLKVIVIGSPSPGEIRAQHPLQFVNAARSYGVDENTLWLVERTGYELGNVDLSQIEGFAAPGRLAWITPDQPLVNHLNQLAAGSIGTFRVYSHGLASHVVLRYGWPGQANYGLSIPEVRSLRSDLFAANADIRFDSCNTGTSDWVNSTGNLAQSFADQSGRPVQAWTGRTSYAEVNRVGGTGPAEVRGSQVMRGLSTPDWTEAASRLAGRTPELRTFQPVGGPRVGGFTSTFSITARLPETRTFSVPANGAVMVRCEDVLTHVDGEEDERLEGTPGAPQSFEMALHREVNWGRDESFDVRQFPVGYGAHQEVWSSLQAGTYYLEIWRFGNPLFRLDGNIQVDVHGPRP